MVVVRMHAPLVAEHAPCMCQPQHPVLQCDCLSLIPALLFQSRPDDEQQVLREENEQLKAEIAALKAGGDQGSDNVAPPKQELDVPEILPRPHTTDPGSDSFVRASRDEPPPEGGSLEAIMAWRERKGRSADIADEESDDGGPPRLLARSWLSKNPLSTKPNPVCYEMSRDGNLRCIGLGSHAWALTSNVCRAEQARPLIGNELRPFQHNATPHPASNSVSSVGLSWEHMKIYEKMLRPTSSAASFPATERTSGMPPRVLREVKIRAQ